MEQQIRDERFGLGKKTCDKALELGALGQQEEALKQFDLAEEFFREIEDVHWLTFLWHEKFHCLQELEKYDQARELSDLIVKGYLETKNPRGLALFLTHLAVMYFEIEENYLALESLRQAEAITLKEKFTDLQAYVYTNLAIGYYHLLKYSDAIGSLKKALGYYEAENLPSEQAWCQKQLAFCFRNIYRHQEAEVFFSRAWKSYVKADDPASAIEVLQQLEKLYLLSNKPDKINETNQTIKKLKQNIW